MEVGGGWGWGGGTCAQGPLTAAPAAGRGIQPRAQHPQTKKGFDDEKGQQKFKFHELTGSVFQRFDRSTRLMPPKSWMAPWSRRKIFDLRQPDTAWRSGARRGVVWRSGGTAGHSVAQWGTAQQIIRRPARGACTMLGAGAALQGAQLGRRQARPTRRARRRLRPSPRRVFIGEPVGGAPKVLPVLLNARDEVGIAALVVDL